VHRFVAVGITWLVLLAGTAIVGVLLFNPFPASRLDKAGIRAEGHVTAIEPTNHQIVRYSYIVGGKEYMGVGHGGHGNPRFEDIRVGQSVLVFYDPENPQLSSMGSPNAQVFGNLWVVVIMSLTIPVSIIASLYRMGFFRRKT